MALYGVITHDSRVLREAETLSRAGHTVTVFCLSGSPPESAPFRTVAGVPRRSGVLPDGSSPFLAGRASSFWAKLAGRIRWVVGYAQNIRAWGRWAVATAGDVDVWHAHDLTGLIAVGPAARAPCRLVYDSHEIYLETGTAARLPGPFRRVLSSVEGLLTRRAVALVTVNETFAEVLERRLRPRRTVIVRNCPPRWSPPNPPTLRLREAAAVPEAHPLVLYHGEFGPNRGLEQLAEAMLAGGLERAHLIFLGFGTLRAALDRLAAEARFDGRIHVLGPVPPGDLLEMIAGADVDAIPFQHSTLNHWLCTPNKLWESLTAGTPVVVSDFPAMRRIVRDDPAGPLGEVCDGADPASIGAAIHSVLGQDLLGRDVLRERCLTAARERWNWETESIGLLDLYAGIARDGRSHG